MENVTTPVLIEKESIADLKFPATPIKRSKEEQAALMEKLRMATTLGNIEHGKSRITFHDEEGLKMVETTIWATGEENIVLKQGVVIPIHRIVSVNFY